MSTTPIKPLLRKGVARLQRGLLFVYKNAEVLDMTGFIVFLNDYLPDWNDLV